MTDTADWIAGSTLTELPDLEQGSEAWYDQRRGIVTASVVGQLISVGYLGAEGYDCPDCEAEPYEPCRSKVKRAGEYGTIKTHHGARTDVARDGQHLVIEPADNDTSRGLTTLLAAERITGWTDPTYVNDDMFRGKLEEPYAVDAYSEHYAPVTRTGFLRREGAGLTLGFSPDGLVGDDGLIEVKCRRSKKQVTTILSDEVPAENMAQIQAGLIVSGREWGDYVSFTGGMPLYVKRVLPDLRWFDAIVAAVSKFEKTVAEMVASYNARVDGLPMTERIEQEIVII